MQQSFFKHQYESRINVNEDIYHNPKVFESIKYSTIIKPLVTTYDKKIDDIRIHPQYEPQINIKSESPLESKIKNEPWSLKEEFTYNPVINDDKSNYKLRSQDDFDEKVEFLHDNIVKNETLSNTENIIYNSTYSNIETSIEAKPKYQVKSKSVRTLPKFKNKNKSFDYKQIKKRDD